nr:MAG: hypothetical protein [Bacteriophage sp.]
MNEFNFRVAPRASGSLGPNSGNTTTLIINSFKTKYINGNAGGRTNVAFDDPLSSQVPSWLQISHVWSNAEEAYKVTFKALENNTGAARSFTATFTQRESGKQISYTITQDENFTYTYFLKVLNAISTIGANIGATTTIRVQSYMTRSDGEVMAKSPSVGATPSWASKVIVKDEPLMGGGGAPHWYKIIVEATAANISSAERSEILLVTCGDQRKEVTIRQEAAEQEITLTIHWPRNTYSAAFFKNGQIPGSGNNAYFSYSILDDTSVHKYKKSAGIRVNLRNGNTEIAYPGDRISAYRFINQAWELRSTFILPSSDQSITV